jgi:hypothetical protein
MKKIIGIFAVLGILASVAIGIWKNMLFFSNTFGITHLLFRGATLGALVGLAIGWGVVRSRKTALDGIERFQTMAGFAVLLAIAAPIWAVWSNQAFAESKEISRKVTFVREDAKVTSRAGVSVGNKFMTATDALKTNEKPDLFYTYFTDSSHDIERIRSEQAMYLNTQPNTPIDLPVHRGFWGFDVVK